MKSKESNSSVSSPTIREELGEDATTVYLRKWFERQSYESRLTAVLFYRLTRRPEHLSEEVRNLHREIIERYELDVVQEVTKPQPRELLVTALVCGCNGFFGM